jgi:hypothetical protein
MCPDGYVLVNFGIVTRGDWVEEVKKDDGSIETPCEPASGLLGESIKDGMAVVSKKHYWRVYRNTSPVDSSEMKELLRRVVQQCRLKEKVYSCELADDLAAWYKKTFG